MAASDVDGPITPAPLIGCVLGLPARSQMATGALLELTRALKRTNAYLWPVWTSPPEKIVRVDERF